MSGKAREAISARVEAALDRLRDQYMGEVRSYLEEEMRRWAKGRKMRGSMGIRFMDAMGVSGFLITDERGNEEWVKSLPEGQQRRLRAIEDWYMDITDRDALHSEMGDLQGPQA